jgi:hypothetical protein
MLAIGLHSIDRSVGCLDRELRARQYDIEAVFLCKGGGLLVTVLALAWTGAAESQEDNE